MEPGGLPTLLALVGWSVVLLLVHVFVQAGTATRETGLDYNAGPRDEGRRAAGPLAGRADRALRNFLETYPAFVGLALALAMGAEPGGWGTTGAWLWFAARIVYMPLYLLGVPVVRSLAWGASVLGLLLMMAALLL